MESESERGTARSWGIIRKGSGAPLEAPPNQRNLRSGGQWGRPRGGSGSRKSVGMSPEVRQGAHISGVLSGNQWPEASRGAAEVTRVPK